MRAHLSAAAVTIAAALTLSACSAEPVADPAPRGDTASVIYLSALHDTGISVIAAQPDADLLSAGFAVCDSIAGGTGLDAIVAAGEATALGTDGTGAIVEQAVRYLCPEHLSALMVYRDSHQ